MEMQTREAKLDLICREGGEGSEMVVEGYFALYDDETQLAPNVREVIRAGAFDAALRDRDVLALYGHEHNSVLGRTSSGTLALRSDAKGLYGTVSLPNTTLGRDVYELVKRGDLKGCSFGFPPGEKKRAEVLPGGVVRYELLEMDLREVSITPIPAYPNSSIQARSAEAAALVAENLREKKDALKKRLEETHVKATENREGA